MPTLRNAKRSDEGRLEEASRKWEQDLEFLHDRYHVGRFGLRLADDLDQ
jgi:hypothetical protein